MAKIRRQHLICGDT